MRRHREGSCETNHFKQPLHRVLFRLFRAGGSPDLRERRRRPAPTTALGRDQLYSTARSGSQDDPHGKGITNHGLRLVQLVISTAAALVAFEGVDTLNLPLVIGAGVVGLVAALAIGLIRAANNRERRRAGLPPAASAAVGVALAFSLLGLVGTAGAGAVVWTNDTCTMQMGTQNANITLTGFFSKQVCQNVESSSQNKVLGILGDADRVLSKLPVVGGIFGAVGTAQFHDGSPSGGVICTGWLRQARWVVVTVRDQGILDIYAKSMCGSLNSKGLLTYPWDR